MADLRGPGMSLRFVVEARKRWPSSAGCGICRNFAIISQISRQTRSFVCSSSPFHEGRRGEPGIIVMPRVPPSGLYAEKTISGIGMSVYCFTSLTATSSVRRTLLPDLETRELSSARTIAPPSLLRMRISSADEHNVEGSASAEPIRMLTLARIEMFQAERNTRIGHLADVWWRIDLSEELYEWTR